MESKIRTIKLGDEELFTMDEPEVNPEDFVEEELSFDEDADVEEIPACLWRDGTQDEKPQEPGKEVDEVAAEVELKRLMSLNVLRDAQPSDDSIQRTLTTRFVYDWRWKPTGKAEGGQKVDKIPSSNGCVEHAWLQGNMPLQKGRGTMSSAQLRAVTFSGCFQLYTFARQLWMTSQEMIPTFWGAWTSKTSSFK